MGKIGYGYGSEWHLLRYLGRHRQKLNEEIIKKIGFGDNIEWLDFHFNPRKEPYDAEREGLDFLTGPEYKGVRAAWKKFWPQSGKSQNWDAVGWLYFGGEPELILVEAKAHTGELISNCGATGKGRVKIKNAFAEVTDKLKLSVTPELCLRKYYQYANRLAALYFLRENEVKKVPSRLVAIYFYGDKFRSGKSRKGKDDVCPADKTGWNKTLAAQDKHLGLKAGHKLEPYIRKVFLPVKG